MRIGGDDYKGSTRVEVLKPMVKLELEKVISQTDMPQKHHHTFFYEKYRYVCDHFEVQIAPCLVLTENCIF